MLGWARMPWKGDGGQGRMGRGQRKGGRGICPGGSKGLSADREDTDVAIGK